MSGLEGEHHSFQFPNQPLLDRGMVDKQVSLANHPISVVIFVEQRSLRELDEACRGVGKIDTGPMMSPQKLGGQTLWDHPDDGGCKGR